MYMTSADSCHISYSRESTFADVSASGDRFAANCRSIGSRSMIPMVRRPTDGGEPP